MDRITDKHLDALAARLNKLTGSPETAYTRTTEGRVRANAGHFHISHAYGGVALHRMCNESGGVSTPLGYGNEPKRALYEKMHAYIRGIELAGEEALPSRLYHLDEPGCISDEG